MSHKKILWMLPIIFLGIILFTGCKNKDIPSSASKKQPVEKINSDQQKSTEQEKLPAPTGNISDAVNAINSEIEEEEDLVSKEEDDAEEAVSDKAEADNFGAIYDENEF